jgi:hypothetical protein
MGGKWATWRNQCHLRSRSDKKGEAEMIMSNLEKRHGGVGTGFTVCPLLEW